MEDDDLYGGELIALRDTDDDGAADLVVRRPAPAESGIALYNGYLYISDTQSVSRVPLEGDVLMPTGAFETIVGGLAGQTEHASKTFTISPKGELFLNIGAPSNACQRDKRKAGSPGFDPCLQLRDHAGVWRFDANIADQTLSDGAPYATGARHTLASAWNKRDNALFLVTQGRDQLNQLWPEYFGVEDNALLVAEEFHRISPGDNLGWPYTYFDGQSMRRKLSPEYGGDGAMEPGARVYKDPIYAFPAHWAPIALAFYDGKAFPSEYRGGAFISFHGSWDRAPFPQAGFNVVFTPMRKGKITGHAFEFATGFAGAREVITTEDARHRPSGLAVGPKGALYIADSVHGHIWKIDYIEH